MFSAWPSSADMALLVQALAHSPFTNSKATNVVPMSLNGRLYLVADFENSNSALAPFIGRVKCGYRRPVAYDKEVPPVIAIDIKHVTLAEMSNRANIFGSDRASLAPWAPERVVVWDACWLDFAASECRGNVSAPTDQLRFLFACCLHATPVYQFREGHAVKNGLATSA